MKTVSLVRRSNIQILLLGCLFLIALAVVQPYLWRLVSSTADSVRQQRAAVRELNNIQTIVQELEQEDTVADSAAAQLSQVLISEDEVTQAVERLEREADKRGVELVVDNIQRTSDQASSVDLVQLVITVTAFGTSDKLLEYVDAMEHFPEIIFARDFVLRPAPARSINGVSMYALDMNAVYYMNIQASALREASGGGGTNTVTSTAAAPTRDRLYFSSILISITGGILLAIGIIVMVKKRSLI